MPYKIFLIFLSSIFVSSSIAKSSGRPPFFDLVEIRRTTDGIPHIRANSWYNLGRGIGYAQAEDALCTLAEAFITYEGRRSLFFSADEYHGRNATFSYTSNRELDFFFRRFLDQKMIEQYRKKQIKPLNQMIAGYVSGYNRYLRDAYNTYRQTKHSCLHKPWIRKITTDDIYRRLYASQIVGGLSNFIPEIISAIPNQADKKQEVNADKQITLRIGSQTALGSNALAFGEQVAGENSAVLFANPHWLWSGPDRFYQMHLTLPGKLDVAGVGFLAIPVIMIGFNHYIAWGHTVSEARRFGFFDLSLDPKDPTRYLLDERSKPMKRQRISIDVRMPDGSIIQETRIFYDSEFGPLINLSEYNPIFSWNKKHAVAIRDVNMDNFHTYNQFFYWNQATSLDELIKIQRREAALPWVNTLAIARRDGRVWYADIGAVPNVPDQLKARCSTPLSDTFTNIDELLPFLDGSRSACKWQESKKAPRSGMMPADEQPWLLRRDYVANMNNSYWLSNIKQPLEGYPLLMGGEKQALSLRARLGHHIALEQLAHPVHSPKILAERLKQIVLDSRVYSAELFKEDVLKQACIHPKVKLNEQTLKMIAENSSIKVEQETDISFACSVLAKWSNKGDSHDQGVLLWETLWRILTEQFDEEENDPFQIPFSSNMPITTPAVLHISHEQAAQALAAAVVLQKERGIPLHAPLGDYRYVKAPNKRLPLYGGCSEIGYFTDLCPHAQNGRIDKNTDGNTYLQLVYFSRNQVKAYTLLAHGLNEEAINGNQGTAPIERYSKKEWLDFPFYNQDIIRNMKKKTILLP